MRIIAIGAVLMSGIVIVGCRETPTSTTELFLKFGDRMPKTVVYHQPAYADLIDRNPPQGRPSENLTLLCRYDITVTVPDPSVFAEDVAQAIDSGRAEHHPVHLPWEEFEAFNAEGKKLYRGYDYVLWKIVTTRVGELKKLDEVFGAIKAGQTWIHTEQDSRMKVRYKIAPYNSGNTAQLVIQCRQLF